VTPRWQVETTEQFDRDFKKLDQAIQRRVMAYLEEIETLNDPRQRGKGLTANHTGV
jgi:mRNA interferase RelE/StbE